MSEATVAEEGSPQTSKISEVVIRIAGNSQDGIQSIGGFLARLAGRSEQEVMTFMTIPSTISGGPSIFQVRVGTGEVLSAGDDADMLLAFYQHSYENHLDSLKPGGVVLYDSDHVEEKEEFRKDYRHVGIPMSSLTVEAIGGTAKDRGKNIFALGLIARTFGLNVEKLTGLIDEKFRSKPAKVLKTALAAFEAGFAYNVGNIFETFQFEDGEHRDYQQVVMSGNEALSFGLIAAGIRFGAGYPITPWSDIMESLRRELPKYGGKFIQCEDEIAAVSMAIGAGYAGVLSVTGSSGPGISLKSEALGWAQMAEIPIVVVDVQRGGPSTGMPTNVEQSDLNIACYGAHGDSPRVVIAPANVEDCFYTAIEAVNIAKKYSVPVMLVTDQAIATRIEAFADPDLENLMQDLSPDLTPVKDHKPYDLSVENGITTRVVPGTRIESGKYPIATGLEHDELGHPTGSPKLHLAMMAKRRNKLKALGRELPTPKVYGPPEGNILLVGWGSTEGPIHESVDRARAAGDSISSMNIRHINPLPEGLENIFSGFHHVFVVEMNDEGLYGYGQLGGLLRARYADPKIRGINKTDGLTWKVKEILSRAKELLEQIAAEK